MLQRHMHAAGRSLGAARPGQPGGRRRGGRPDQPSTRMRAPACTHRSLAQPYGNGLSSPFMLGVIVQPRLSSTWPMGMPILHWLPEHASVVGSHFSQTAERSVTIGDRGGVPQDGVDWPSRPALLLPSSTAVRKLREELSSRCRLSRTFCRGHGPGLPDHRLYAERLQWPAHASVAGLSLCLSGCQGFHVEPGPGAGVTRV